MYNVRIINIHVHVIYNTYVHVHVHVRTYIPFWTFLAGSSTLYDGCCRIHSTITTYHKRVANSCSYVSSSCITRRGERERETYVYRQRDKTGRGMNKGIGTSDKKTDRETNRQRRTVRIHTERIMNDTCTCTMQFPTYFLHEYTCTCTYTLVPWTQERTHLWKRPCFPLFFTLMVVLAHAYPLGGHSIVVPMGGQSLGDTVRLKQHVKTGAVSFFLLVGGVRGTGYVLLVCRGNLLGNGKYF